MTLCTLDLQVPTLERKIRLRMIERFLVESREVPVSTFMFGMAGFTLAFFDVLDPAM